MAKGGYINTKDSTMDYKDIVIEKGLITRINKDGSVESKPFDVSVKEVECQIGSEPYYLYADHENKFWLEERCDDIHMFLGVTFFYNFIFEHGRIPTQKEFWREYRETYADELTWSWQNGVHCMTVRGKTVTTKRFLARLLKSYPSYLRDYHVFVMMNNSPFYRDKFRYSLATDLDGIDLTVRYKDKDYFFGLDIKTNTSAKFEEEKRTIRHKDKLGMIHYLRLGFEEAKFIRGVSPIKKEQFMVYDFDKIDKQIQRVINGEQHEKDFY